MLNLDKIIDLPQEKVADLRKIIKTKRAELKKVGPFVNDIVREDIFDILDHYCTVVYFPLPDEENDGFHVTMPVDYKENGTQEHFLLNNYRKAFGKAGVRRSPRVWTHLGVGK